MPPIDIQAQADVELLRNGSGDFDIEALYFALDAQRKARGLSWQQATREISNQFRESSGTRQLSASTVMGLRGKRSVEGDGVLQMLLWLDRTPESFTPGLEGAGAPLLHVGPDRIRRWDTRALYEAVNALRVERGLTWQQAATDAGCSVNSLTGLARASRVGLPGVMRVVRWLGRPAAEFTRASNR
jgi:hypothetical protein